MYKLAHQYVDTSQLKNNLNTHLLIESCLLNGKFTEAGHWLDKELFNYPNDSTALKLKDQLNLLQGWTSIPEKGFVNLVPKINSPQNDFSPVWLGDTLVFCSNRPNASVSNKSGTTYEWLQTIRQSNDSLPFSQPTLFAKSLQTIGNEGPICFSSHKDTLYFTRSVRGLFTPKKEKVPLEICYAVKTKNGWSSSKTLSPGPAGYNYTHPCLGDGGKKLFYASNQPGGFGQMDIWVMTRQAGGWSKGKNLGPGVNTPGNEVFPTWNNHQLYFSSDGWPGYGKLDIFETGLDGNYSFSENIKSPVNSAWDDFGLTFSSITEGWFSSSRPNSIKGDNLWKWKLPTPENVFARLKGQFSLDGKAVPNLPFQVYDSLGNKVIHLTTNDSGKFVWSNATGGIKYRIVPESIPSDSSGNLVLTLYNNKNQPVQRLVANDSGEFIFQLLAPDDFNNLALLNNKDESLLHIDVKGQLIKTEKGDVGKGVRVYILDSKGNLLGETRTKQDGIFTFQDLNPAGKYLLRSSLNGDNLKVLIMNDKGEVIATLLREHNGEFIYQRLNPDENSISLLNENDVRIQVDTNESFRIPNIYYGFNKWNITPESASQLQKLVKILRLNPHIGVALGSHTDSRGSKEYNLKLSQKRADAAIQYIVSQGIDPSRVSGKGYGESQPVNGCVDGVPCTEAQYAENRRTEFKIRSRFE